MVSSRRWGTPLRPWAAAWTGKLQSKAKAANSDQPALWNRSSRPPIRDDDRVNFGQDESLILDFAFCWKRCPGALSRASCRSVSACVGGESEPQQGDSGPMTTQKPLQTADSAYDRRYGFLCGPLFSQIDFSENAIFLHELHPAEGNFSYFDASKRGLNASSQRNRNPYSHDQTTRSIEIPPAKYAASLACRAIGRASGACRDHGRGF